MVCCSRFSAILSPLPSCFSSAFRPPPRSPLFPYTTLFRSVMAYALYDLRVRKRGNVSIIGEVGASSKDPTHDLGDVTTLDRKSTRLNSSHTVISYAVFCLKKKSAYTLVGDHTGSVSRSTGS